MKITKKHLVLTVLLPVQIVIIQFLSTKSAWIEHYYSNGIYPYISKFLRTFLGWIPFSFGDLVLIMAFILLLKEVYHIIKNRCKNILPKLFKFTSIISVLLFCFYFFWGLNYFREPLAKNLGITQSKYTTEQLLQTTEEIISKLNSLQLHITKNDTIQVAVPYSPKELYKLAVNGYENISKTYPQLTYKQPSIKSSLLSLLHSYTGTAGYLNPITGEAQVNNMVPITSYPATTCHEMAHQIGWSAENEANFIGFLTTTANEDVYFQYSGYRMVFGYCIAEVRKRDKDLAKNLWKTVNKGIIKDYKAASVHWQQFKNPIEPYIKKGYNSYLKANNQKKGIKSYSYVVDLLIHYFENKHNL